MKSIQMAFPPACPFDVQQALVRSIKGFEQAHIVRPGYAIEYDFFDPRDLRPWLESKFISGLFLAGQINGTTGYEEAAAQGLIAGLNAGLRVREKDHWSPRRDQAYIGVLIDDLITRGTSEPYRMFTSRAEHRLLLREDNADLRLTGIGRELGLVNDAHWRVFSGKRNELEEKQAHLQQIWVRPDHLPKAQAIRILGRPLTKAVSLLQLLRRPGVSLERLQTLADVNIGEMAQDVALQIEVQAKYHGYIERQGQEIARNLDNENARIPEQLDYGQLAGLSNELAQKLSAQRPLTLGQAARIPGMTPAAVSILRIYLKKHSRPLKRSA